MKRRYCLDTNAFIEPWNKYFSMSRCPEYWNIIDKLGQGNVVFCPDQVKREIDKTDDALKAWLNARTHLVRAETVEVQKIVREILKEFPHIISVGAERSMADPWVIAHAAVEKAVVVSKEYVESPKQGATRVKIPDVCRHYKIPCINDFAFVDEVGIKFDARLP